MHDMTEELLVRLGRHDNLTDAQARNHSHHSSDRVLLVLKGCLVLFSRRMVSFVLWSIVFVVPYNRLSNFVSPLFTHAVLLGWSVDDDGGHVIRVPVLVTVARWHSPITLSITSYVVI